MKPFCFALVPFSTRPDPAGAVDIDFDAIWEQAVRPAVVEAGMVPHRVDPERLQGMVHRSVLEDMVLADCVIAELTLAGPEVYHALGVRHVVRPGATVPVHARHHRAPIHLQPDRPLAYDLEEPAIGEEEAFKPMEALRRALVERLEELREGRTGPARSKSPVHQLLKQFAADPVGRLPVDRTRERVADSRQVRQHLEEGRDERDLDALDTAWKALRSAEKAEPSLLLDLLLSFRDLEAWDRVIAVVEQMPDSLKGTVVVQELLAEALMSTGRGERAEEILEACIERHGPASDTCSLLGRAYEVHWERAHAVGRPLEAASMLRKAIEAFLRGFEADWRDPCPGIRALVLLDVAGDPESLERKAEILPVVRYAVMRRIRDGQSDPRDQAALLELAVLDFMPEQAVDHLREVMSAEPGPWEPAATVRDLLRIRDARAERGEGSPWIDDLVGALEQEPRTSTVS